MTRLAAPVPLYWALLGLVCWLPIPLGSNRNWAWAIAVAWIGLLAIGWLAAWASGRAEVTYPYRKARAAMVLFGLWITWLVVQLIPLPPGWLAILSPEALGHYQSAPDAEITGTLLARWLPDHFLPITVDQTATLKFLARSFAYVTLFALVLLTVTSRERLRGLGYALVLSGLFQASYGGLMTLSGIEWGFGPKEHGLGVATGTFVNRNHLAGYLEMTLAVGIGLLIADLGGGTATHWRARLRDWIAVILSRKAIVRLALVVMVIALVLTRSRMGNTAFFTSLLIAGAIALMQSRHATRSTIVLLVSLLVIDLFIVGAWFGVDQVIDRLRGTEAVVLETPATSQQLRQAREDGGAPVSGDLPDPGEGRARRFHLVTEDRDEIADSALVLRERFPVTGSGGGTFYGIYPITRQETMRAWNDHVHNDYIQLLVETGPLGLLLLGGVVVLAFAKALTAQQRRRDPLTRGMAFAVIMGGSALMLHAITDFNHQIPANAATFTMLLALAWLARHLGHER
ncbi:MAG: hypothetical protein DRR03_07725 [Gammaproteobacteria bacterium]|nr:MAG: hypothetical protein DRR03_07725 [Gammaproteobacteria bacterium]